MRLRQTRNLLHRKRNNQQNETDNLQNARNYLETIDKQVNNFSLKDFYHACFEIFIR